jgi:hypothetical protein
LENTNLTETSQEGCDSKMAVLPILTILWHFRYIYVKKVKLSPVTGLWDVEAPEFSRQSAHRWCGKVVSLTRQPLFTPGKFVGARGSVVGWGTMLQAGRSRVRFPMRSLDFFFSIYLSFQPHYGLGVDSAPNRNEYQESSNIYSVNGKMIHESWIGNI